MSNTPIKLQVTLDQANLILEALGEQPFIKVFELIKSIQTQAKQQLDAASPASEPQQTPTLLESAGGE